MSENVTADGLGNWGANCKSATRVSHNLKNTDVIQKHAKTNFLHDFELEKVVKCVLNHFCKKVPDW